MDKYRPPTAQGPLEIPRVGPGAPGRAATLMNSSACKLYPFLHHCKTKHHKKIEDRPHCQKAPHRLLRQSWCCEPGASDACGPQTTTACSTQQPRSPAREQFHATPMFSWNLRRNRPGAPPPDEHWSPAKLPPRTAGRRAHLRSAAPPRSTLLGDSWGLLQTCWRAQSGVTAFVAIKTFAKSHRTYLCLHLWGAWKEGVGGQMNSPSSFPHGPGRNHTALRKATENKTNPQNNHMAASLLLLSPGRRNLGV